MRIRSIQHVPFEGIGAIADWAATRGHEVAGTHVYLESFPHPGEFEMLVVMGGPMNIYQEREFPWLAEEKRFIRAAIDEGKLVLGICLGAQLLADVLGGEVVRGEQPEIGWFPVELSPQGAESAVFGVLPTRFETLHWHGDTFTIPPGACRTASSELTPNQAFEYDSGRVVALQFHLEATLGSWSELAAECAGELDPVGPWVRSAAEMLGPVERFEKNNRLLFDLLDAMAARHVAV